MQNRVGRGWDCWSRGQVLTADGGLFVFLEIIVYESEDE